MSGFQQEQQNHKAIDKQESRAHSEEQNWEEAFQRKPNTETLDKDLKHLF